MNNNVLLTVGAIAGGVGKHVFDIISGLHRKFNLTLSYSTEDADSEFQKRIGAITQMIGGSNTVPLAINKRPELRDLVNIFELRRFIRTNGIFLVHGHGAKGGAYARLLAMLCPEVRSIYTPHGGAIHPMHGVIGDKVYKCVEEMLYPHTDVFLFESQYTQNSFFDRICTVPDSERFKINYNGVDVSRISEPEHAKKILITEGFPSAWLLRRSPKEIHCCCIAFVRPIKGQAVLLRAWKSLLSRQPDAYLHLLGPVDDIGGVRALIHELDIESRILVYGDVPNARRLLSLYDYCLVPSLFESFGYVAVEAMCEGVPVIASRTGGLVEIISDKRTGMLVAPGDPLAWTNALCDLFENPMLGPSWINAARAEATERFSLTSMIQNIADVYSAHLGTDRVLPGGNHNKIC